VKQYLHIWSHFIDCLVNSVLVPCRICAGSTCSYSCSSIVFSNGNCTISAECLDLILQHVPTNITLTPGSGNGCYLANAGGTLICLDFCYWMEIWDYIHFDSIISITYFLLLRLDNGPFLYFHLAYSLYISCFNIKTYKNS